MVIVMDRCARIFVAGHNGLVGSALCRRLQADGYTSVMTVDRRTLDLRDRTAVERWCLDHRPEYILMAAGTVGGIMANSTRPAEFIFDNLAMQIAVAHAAYLCGTKKLLMLGSSCIYPRECPQPIKEEYLLTGPLEPTNEAYALAKIAAIVMGRAYRAQFGCNVISVMPSNLYGPHDNFDVAGGHVLPALIHRFHEAKRTGQPALTLWGSGSPMREFLHVDDMADACLFLMAHYHDAEHINIGTGEEISIRDLAAIVRDVVYPDAIITFDHERPDGCPRKVLDVSKLHGLGWRHSRSLREGVADTYAWFLDRLASGDGLPRGVHARHPA
jgi:GDP-L-fucose synthase